LELAPAALAAAACRRLYDELSDLQDRLGQVCDQIVAMGQLKEWQEEAHSSAVRGELQKARARQRKQLADGRQAFLRWWSAGRRAAVASRLRRALKG
jgi:CHAD domain-containing protein